ncbi:MAG: dual specificity protein phosphatase family protein [SAR324 cluster bacterium]|nr:dual specificity protein phosphatase family protein [SAR324 cluster bacterium]
MKPMPMLQNFESRVISIIDQISVGPAPTTIKEMRMILKKFDAILNVSNSPVPGDIMDHRKNPYLQIPVMDACGIMIPVESLITATTFGLLCLENQRHLLIHCSAGLSRSPSFTIVLLMIHQELTFNQATELVLSRNSAWISSINDDLLSEKNMLPLLRYFNKPEAWYSRNQ